ncbi:uncharacterized protein MalAC0309_1666 [Microcella alkaliphila]|uniref:Integral membrane protein n=1 Tax=Microcella alkaliphila TaxID=279828 RepID=A0A0U5B9N0_9MICO|nr:uncharacterized protein MalAC0309_1666 [Microcella alkaliphila]
MVVEEAAVTLPAPPSARSTALGAGLLAGQLLTSVLLVVSTGGLLDVMVSFEPPQVSQDGSFAFVAGAGIWFSAEAGMLPVLLVTGAVLASRAVRASRGALSAHAASTLHWVAVSQSLGITIVIVALLNGVTAAATIVALYALAAGSGMLGWLSDRASRHDGSRGHLWPYAFLTVIAIVPWGVVALVQVTGIVVGAPASEGVRVTTLVVLAATVLWAVAEWAIARPAGIARDPARAATLRVASSAALASIPAGAVVALGVLGG